MHRNSARARLSKGLAIAAATVLMTAAAHEVAAAPDSHELRYDDAVRELMQERYAAAFSRFSKLADAGHRSSALMALALVRYRPTALGDQWAATPPQLQRWSGLAREDNPRYASAVGLEDSGHER